jgi:prevent-host-death family protein
MISPASVDVPAITPFERSLPIYDHGNLTTVMNQNSVTATYFKAHCLRLLDQVAETGEELTITKYGKPVARLVAPEVSGDLRGSATIHLADDELVRASMGMWDVERS